MINEILKQINEAIDNVNKEQGGLIFGHVTEIEVKNDQT